VNAIVVPSQQNLERIAVAARSKLDEIAIGSKIAAEASTPAPVGASGRSVMPSIAPNSIDELLFPFKG
jgi:hypothetical protein